MGEVALADAREADARSCHERARVIADRVDLPLEQARALEGLARCSLHRGERGDASISFNRALAIYRQFNSVNARRLEETLRQDR